MTFTILDEILDRVRTRLSADKARWPISEIKKRVADAPPVVSFANSLNGPFGLIAEIKRRSPSQGSMLHQEISDVARTYEKHPFVRAVSVLTNRDDFGMSIEDLKNLRPLIQKPILRKDFILDDYQVYEARAAGADAVLLMANILTDKKKLTGLFDLSRHLGMDVLFECRDKSEIDSIPSGARIFGINSRKLKAKKVFGMSRYTAARWLRPLGVRDKSIEYSVFDLVRHIPRHALKVAESGLEPREITTVRDEFHYNSALIGTAILNSPLGVKAALDQFSGVQSYVRTPIRELSTSR